MQEKSFVGEDVRLKDLNPSKFLEYAESHSINIRKLLSQIPTTNMDVSLALKDEAEKIAELIQNCSGKRSSETAAEACERSEFVQHLLDQLTDLLAKLIGSSGRWM